MKGSKSVQEQVFGHAAQSFNDPSSWPLLICLLGSFRVLHVGKPILVRGEKTETLLSYLALRYADGVSCDILRDTIWPGSDANLAGDALNSRVYSLNKALAPAIGGAMPILHGGGMYRLNSVAGVGVDAAWFDALVTDGDCLARVGQVSEAAASYRLAIEVYRGDLSGASDLHAVVERERLRARYLSMMTSLANDAFNRRDDAACLAYAQHVLEHDPCREDAHRLIMRCYVHLGQRAQALHQYGVCKGILHAAFEMGPEPASVALFEQIRANPDSL